MLNFSLQPEGAQQVLRSVLRGYIPEARLAQALHVWQEECKRGQSVFIVLTHFCKRMGSEFGLRGREPELHLRIFQALQDARSAALVKAPEGATAAGQRVRAGRKAAPAVPASPPAPAAASAPPPAGAEPSRAVGSASSRLIERFFLLVETLLKRDHGWSPRQWHEACAAQIASQEPPWSDRERAAFVAWLGGSSANLAGAWPAGSAGTRAVNLMYVALAESLGPMLADRMFTRAVALLEREGGDYAEIRAYL
ncbi:MAG: hypothetical protein JNM98_15345 [Rhodocyclaceae bacterium]|nr:hypothetical protein [Rhodocyclaceae bacterium]